MKTIPKEFIERAREVLARECDKSSAFEPRARVYRNGRGDDLPELLALAHFMRGCRPRPLHELMAEDEAAKIAAAQPVTPSAEECKNNALDFLLRLRNEVLDWQRALCGEREGLDDLCNEIDEFFDVIGVTQQ